MIEDITVSPKLSRAVYEYISKHYKYYGQGIYQTTKKIYSSLDTKYIINERLPVVYGNLVSRRVHNFLDFWGIYYMNDCNICNKIIDEYKSGNYAMVVLGPEIINDFKDENNESDQLVDYALVTVLPIRKGLTIVNCDFLTTIN